MVIPYFTEYRAARADRYSTRGTSWEEGLSRDILVRRLSSIAFDVLRLRAGRQSCDRQYGEMFAGGALSLNLAE